MSKLLVAKEQQKALLVQQSKASLTYITITKFTPKGKGTYLDFQVFIAPIEALCLNNEMY